MRKLNAGPPRQGQGYPYHTGERTAGGVPSGARSARCLLGAWTGLAPCPGPDHPSSGVVVVGHARGGPSPWSYTTVLDVEAEMVLCMALAV